MRHEVIGYGERCGAGADAGDALAVLHRRDSREKICDVVTVVGRDAFQPADGHGFFHDAVLGKRRQSPAAAGGFAGAVTGSAENCGEDIRLAIDHVGIGKSALRDQPDVFGTFVVCGAGHWQSTTLWNQADCLFLTLALTTYCIRRLFAEEI